MVSEMISKKNTSKKTMDTKKFEAIKMNPYSAITFHSDSLKMSR